MSNRTPDSGPAGNASGSTGNASGNDGNGDSRDADGSSPTGNESGNDGLVPEGMTWDVGARERQQELFDMLSDRFWNCFQASEQEYLLRNVGHALFGPPDEEPSNENRRTGYTAEKLAEISTICDSIKQHDKHNDQGSETFMAVVFVVLKVECNGNEYAIPEPVFRVPNDTESGEMHVFIDRNNRVYRGWEKYLLNNKLPDCMYCYPMKGVYEHYGDYNVLVMFGTTPAGGAGRKWLSRADTVGTVVSVGAACVGLASLVAIPVAAPILLASAVGSGVVGAYGAGRGAEVLIDRGMHGQSVGLDNAEARNSWLGIAASTLGFAAAGATTTAATLARNGDVLGKAGRFTVNAIQISSLTVNGIGIVAGAINLHEKYKSDNLTPLDIFQFSSSVLFFTNSVMNVKTASTIIKENQQNVMKDYRAQLKSNRHRKAFDKVARNTRRGNDGIVGDGKVIKGIRNINNPDDFFSGVARLQKHHKQSEADISFTDSNKVDINGKIKVEPSKFADVNKAQRQEILVASKKVDEGLLASKNFDKLVEPVYHDMAGGINKANSATTNVASDTVQAPDAQPFTSDIGQPRPDYFSSLSPGEMQRYGSLIVGALGPKVLEVVMDLMKGIGHVRITEFIDYLEFSFDFVKEILAEMVASYESMVELIAMLDGDSFRRDDFDRSQGIIGDRTDHFLKLISEMCSVGRKCMEFREAFQRFRASRRSTNNTEDQNASNPQRDHTDTEPNVAQTGATNDENSVTPDDQPNVTDNHPSRSNPTDQPGASTSSSQDPHEYEYLDTELNSRIGASTESSINGESIPCVIPRSAARDGDRDRPSQSQEGMGGSSQSEVDTDSSSQSDTEETDYWRHRDFSACGPLTDADHYSIAQEVTCLMVDASVVTLKRRGEETFVMFRHCDVVVTICSDANRNRVTANVTDGR